MSNHDLETITTAVIYFAVTPNLLNLYLFFWCALFWCALFDSSPQPLDHESSPFTTRPWLSPFKPLRLILIKVRAEGWAGGHKQGHITQLVSYVLRTISNFVRTKKVE